MSLVKMILLISFLILIHELGHFWAARLFKIRVDKFGFGLPFGPTLFRKKFGDLEILVHAFLLGGYVSFPDDDKDCDLPKDSKERFINKPIWQKTIVISAGVFANYVFAVLMIFFVCLFWGKLPTGKYNVFIEKIIAPQNAIVWQTGIKEKDTIFKINGYEITHPTEVNTYFMKSRKFDGTVNKKRVKNKLKQLKELNPQINEKDIIPENTVLKLPKTDLEEPLKLERFQALGVEKFSDEIKLDDNQKEIRKNCYEKDSFVVNKKDLKLKDIAIAISDTQNQIMVIVLRENKQIQIKPFILNESGKLNIALGTSEQNFKPKNILDSVKYSNEFLVDNTKMMFVSLEKLVTGKVELNKMNGIVAITKIGSDVIKREGMYKGLILTAIISLNLAIMNLLPIPALDGGHLMFLFIEKVTGKPLNEKTIEKVNTICFYLLMLLMVLVLFNDIKFITKKF